MTLTVRFPSAPSERDKQAICVFLRESSSSSWTRYGPDVISYSGSTATFNIPTIASGAQAKVTFGSISSDIINVNVQEVPSLTIDYFSCGEVRLDLSGNDEGIARVSDSLLVWFSLDGTDWTCAANPVTNITWQVLTENILMCTSTEAIWQIGEMTEGFPYIKFTFNPNTENEITTAVYQQT